MRSPELETWRGKMLAVINCVLNVVRTRLADTSCSCLIGSFINGSCHLFKALRHHHQLVFRPQIVDGWETIGGTMTSTNINLDRSRLEVSHPTAQDIGYSALLERHQAIAKLSVRFGIDDPTLYVTNEAIETGKGFVVIESSIVDITTLTQGVGHSAVTVAIALLLGRCVVVLRTVVALWCVAH